MNFLFTFVLLKLRYFWRLFQRCEVDVAAISEQQRLMIRAKFRFLSAINVSLEVQDIDG